MLILLPPSEGKARPELGEPIDLDSLVFAEELGAKREALIDAFDPRLREAPAGRRLLCTPVSFMDDWGWRSCRRRRGSRS
ncbi:MAG: hypothetical protein QOF06_318 [Solirubrobacterales bacterium]|jgi:hypothetical protein|nr:hypothetical protein [Solirubrobacterales bacterium]